MKLNYTALFCLLSGVSGLVGLVIQSVYPMLSGMLFLLFAAYHLGKQRQTIQNRKGEI